MSLEAEQAIVAAMIESAEEYESVTGSLVAKDFTDERMQLLFELVTKFREVGRAPDLITLSAALTKSERWALTGLDDPVDYLRGLCGATQSFRNISAYVEMVKSASMSRMMFDFCNSVVAAAQDPELSSDEKLALLHASIPVTADTVTGHTEYAEAAKEALREAYSRTEGDVAGISSGMSNVDALTSGFDRGTLVILAGRPSHGKSVYAMDWAHAASREGAVFVFSLEMTATNLAMRGLSSLGQVDFGELRSGRVDEHMVEKLQGAHAQMKTMPILIDDRGGVSVDVIRTRARVMARQNKPAMIVTDYLTLMSGQGGSRTEQVGYVSRSLKAMAKELDCVVLCVAQLNRGVDARPDKRPTLSDLRDSGEIEQDADVVAFTYLHEKYDEDTPRKGCGELIFAKQRNGETGSVFMEWQGRYQRFMPWHGPVPPLKAEEEKPKAKRGMASFTGNEEPAY